MNTCDHHTPEGSRARYGVIIACKGQSPTESYRVLLCYAATALFFFAKSMSSSYSMNTCDPHMPEGSRARYGVIIACYRQLASSAMRIRSRAPRCSFLTLSPSCSLLLSCSPDLLLSYPPALLLSCSLALVRSCSLALLLSCSPALLLSCSRAPLLFCSLTLLLSCSLALLRSCSLALLLSCSPALVPPCSSALLLACSLTLLLSCSLALLLSCSLALSKDTQARQSHILTSPTLLFKMAQNLDLRCVLVPAKLGGLRQYEYLVGSDSMNTCAPICLKDSRARIYCNHCPQSGRG